MFINDFFVSPAILIRDFFCNFTADFLSTLFNKQ